MSMKNVEDLYPLSPMQQGMLYHSLYDDQSGTYVEQLTCSLQGELNAEAFEQAWQRVVDRHAVLRTAFLAEGPKEPVQVVYRRVKLPLLRDDWRGLSRQEQDAKLEAFLQDERRRGFNLAKAPLVRIALIRTGEAIYQFVLVNHHLLMDGWSLPIVLQEVFAFYEAFSQGKELELERGRPYRDYIAWLRKQDLDQAEAFWREELAGFTSPTQLRLDRRVEGEPVFDWRAIVFSKESTSALHAFARQHQLTLNTLVQGAWALLLSRYSGEEDILYGATGSGRPAELAGSETMVGLFINTLPVRVRVDPEKTLLSWLKEFQSHQAVLRQYEYSPLVQIQGWGEVPRGAPLFESIFVFENYPVDHTLQDQDGGLEIGDIRSVEQTNYPINVVSGPGEELELKVIFDSLRFDPQTIQRMLGHYQTLLEAFAGHADRKLAYLPMLAQAERQQILFDWNDTTTAYPQERCIQELFEAHVERSPEAVALVFDEEQLTYQELNRRANQLAHFLIGLGAGPEEFIGFCMDRSVEMVVAILGILKAGAAYVPLDPAYPKERLAFMLEDVQAAGKPKATVLVQEHLLERLPQDSARVVCVDRDWAVIAKESGEPGLQNPVLRTAVENTAYVMYTSGSTGRPKGISITHRGITRLVLNTNYIRMQADDRVSLASNSAFDAATFELWSALLNGARLVGISKEVALSPGELAAKIRDQGITTMFLTTALFNQMAREMPGAFHPLRHLMFGGEAVDPRWVREVIENQPPERLLHVYGPTEGTTYTTWFLVHEVPEDATTVPIGSPLANTQTYVLDRCLQPVPAGIPGELYIGGDGLAREYLRRPELTAEMFIPDPFSTKSGERLYRSGDLVRALPDGNLEFLGRIDHQVKIRGFRIEPGEIDAILAQYPAVQDSIVLVKEDIPGEKRLVAYLVPKADQTLDTSELQSFLRQKLPDYMLPAAFVQLEALPITPNGKIDRRALAAMGQSKPDYERFYIAPRDMLELKLARIWEEILGVRPVGVRDNFFDLGGHSLLAVRLIAQIQRKFEVELPLVMLFQQPTIEHLAGILRTARPGSVFFNSILAPLQPEGTRPPLFFSHPSGGSVHWYSELARELGADQPFYGLQARGLNDDQDPHRDLEEMARDYIREIQSIQPEGPYYLGGWSLGVIVAFVMAQQLQQQGQQVALLALIDQGPSFPGEEPEDDAEYLMDTFGRLLPINLDQLRQLTYEEQVEFILEEARKLNGVPPGITITQFRRYVNILRYHSRAWRHYKPQSYPGHIVVFRASESPVDDSKPADLGWGKLAAGGVEVYEVPGDHITMIHQPHVQVVAEKLKACIAGMQPELSRVEVDHGD